MIDRLEATLKRYNEIGEELSKPDIISDIRISGKKYIIAKFIKG